MTTVKIIELLKSGDFTIAYHDHGHCCLYKGRHEYESLPIKEVAEFYDTDGDGYLPQIVYLLAKALGGASETI